MEAWQWLLVGLAAVAIVPALWLLDRLGLWLEDRGLLFYRKRKPTSSPITSLVAMQQFLEPGVQHVIQAGQERRVEDAEGASGKRLIACLLAALQETPVNPEVIRVYLAQARREGLDWAALYAEAVQRLRANDPAAADLAPAPEDVEPD
jgi:hypothetical protein